MKTLVLLIPGLTDHPQSELDSKTPVEKALTPALDEIAQMGQWIKVQAPKGPIEQSLLELFGVESEKANLSLSSLEVYHQKLPFLPTQSSYLFRFISLYDHQVMGTSPHLLKEPELHLFCMDLNKRFDHWAHFAPIGDSGGVVVIKDAFKQSPAPSLPSLEPGIEYSKLLPQRLNTKDILEKIESIHTYLNEHPVNQVRKDFEEPLANGLFFYEPGAPLNAIVSKEFYKKFCLYTPKSSSQGLANLLHVKKVELSESSTLHYLSDLTQQVFAEFNRHVNVILELNLLLESTLKGNLLEKIKRIEYLDRHFLQPILDQCREEGVQLILTSLKKTDVKKREIQEDPAPWIIYNPRHKKALEPILSFREKELDRIQGSLTIKNLASQFLY